MSEPSCQECGQAITPGEPCGWCAEISAELQRVVAEQRRLVACVDWRVLEAAYRAKRDGIGSRILFETGAGSWRLGSMSAYFHDRRQPGKLTPGEHRAVIVFVGLCDRFPHYVHAPEPVFHAHVNASGATYLPDWRLAQALDHELVAPAEEDAVCRLPMRQPAPLTPTDLGAVRRAIEGDLARIRARVLRAAVRRIELPRETVWHPVWR